MSIKFLKYSKVYFVLSGILIVASLASVLIFGLKFGIEFTGGSIMELSFQEERPSLENIQQSLSEFDLGEIVLQPIGDNEMVLRMKEIDGETHENVFLKLQQTYQAEEKSFEMIGPTIGAELKQKTRNAIIMVLLAITLYITVAFRKVSWSAIRSWQYGVASLLALFHDVIIPLGVLAVLGKLYNIEITIPVIAALLTILGYSVHDTIVIFDRIRENLLKSRFKSFEETVDASLNQTLFRSISTVFTVLLVLFAIFFFGGQTLQSFSLTLIIGITSGAYSSIFVASPLLVAWAKWRQNKGRV
ncbi:MAG TPA: protein translocase subunit SecF [Candidatus Paceibacterota bacterium]|nr:protein translocase subunit SecF [Candidatus Paceibacterota bacterium]